MGSNAALFCNQGYAGRSASSTDALAEDGIKYSVINHDGSNDLVWAKYINLLKSFSIDKNPKRIRRFRRVIYIKW